MSEHVVDAPIVAVTVYPDRARITRRGRLMVPAGDQTVYVEPLPLLLQDDSVRVSGRGPATVLGVDVATQHHPQAPDETVAELERQRRAAQDEIAALTDADDVQVQLETFLAQLAKRAGGSFARTLAAGDSATELGGFTESLASRLAAVRATRREVTAQRGDVDDRIAAIDLDAELDYITAPVRSTDVHLRATVVNSSVHTLPAGKAAVFHDADFVGSAALPLWAPGEDVELALGLDDRIRVERKMVRRGATKATLGSTRRRQVDYETKIENHTPHAARVTVLDQFPVARDHEITVKQLTADPEPAETTDLGVVTWKLDLGPGAETVVKFAFRVDTGKSVDLAGWRE